MRNFKKIGLIVGAISLGGSVALAQETSAPERRAVVVENMDFYGGDLEPRFETTFAACERLCIGDAACTAFTFNTKSSSVLPEIRV